MATIWRMELNKPNCISKLLVGPKVRLGILRNGTQVRPVRPCPFFPAALEESTRFPEQRFGYRVCIKPQAIESDRKESES